MALLANDWIKGFVLWVVLVAGQIVGGLLFFGNAPAFATDGPLEANQAVLVMSAVDAAILAVLARLALSGGWSLGIALAVVLFGVQTFMSLIEAVVFGNDVHIGNAVLLGTAGTSLLRCAAACVAIALLWRRVGRRQAGRLRGLPWKIPLIALLYILCYFTAGFAIAWQSPAVRAFYAHVGDIKPGFLFAVQFGRGLVWCGLVLVLVRLLGRPSWRTSLLSGVALSGFMVPQLLFPNPAMPWPVREVHMIEVAVSNFIFGVAAAGIILLGAGYAAYPRGQD